MISNTIKNFIKSAIQVSFGRLRRRKNTSIHCKNILNSHQKIFKDQDRKIRPEVQALSSNHHKTMTVNNIIVKKGTVARLTSCINFLMNPEDLISEEYHIIDAAIDECLEAFYQTNWHLYFDFKQPYIQNKYDLIRKKYS